MEWNSFILCCDYHINQLSFLISKLFPQSFYFYLIPRIISSLLINYNIFKKLVFNHLRHIERWCNRVIIRVWLLCSQNIASSFKRQWRSLRTLLHIQVKIKNSHFPQWQIRENWKWHVTVIKQPEDNWNWLHKQNLRPWLFCWWWSRWIFSSPQTAKWAMHISKNKRKYGILIQLVILQEGWHHSAFCNKNRNYC